MCSRVEEVQDYLGREIAVENVSAYVAFDDSTMPEWEFVAAVVRRTGCKLLLDVNNVYVNAVNHGFDADTYLAAMPPDAIAEIHLAGFDATGPCLIDTHGARVAPEVWALYRRTIARIGPRPTLIEWDVDIPEFPGARSRSRDGGRHSRRPPCRRCVNCRSALPMPCSPPTGRRRRLDLPAEPAGVERIGIYRRTIATNYRNALGATYPVVRRLVGTPFFDAAVDAYVEAHPSRSGDLNEYGATFGEFLGGYEPASDLPYLPDVARLEWAIDEANRAADSLASPDDVLRELAAVAGGTIADAAGANRSHRSG